MALKLSEDVVATNRRKAFLDCYNISQLDGFAGVDDSLARGHIVDSEVLDIVETEIMEERPR